MENKSTQPVVNKGKEIIKNVKTPDKVNKQEAAVKKIWKELSPYIIFHDSVMWSELHDHLNEGIVGRKVGSKDCYRIGFIEQLKQFAESQSILFAKDSDKFYVYSGEYWINVSEDLLKSFLHEAAEKMGIPKSLSSCVKFIKGTYEQLLESGFFEKMVQANITYINVQNGTLKIDSHGVSLVDFNPKHFLTHQLDFAYNPKIINAKFFAFLNMIMPDKYTQKTLQQAIGYLFIRDLKLEKVIFLYGIGSNGKSVIFELIKGLLDPSMISNYSLVHLTNKLGYQVADLNNRLINYGSDASMKDIDPAVFKQLASGEPIGTRQIREKAFIMINYAKLIFNVNKLDDATIENTHGFNRRLLIIPFEAVISKEQQDKNLHKKLLENKAALMNWIIEGIEEVLKNEEIFISDKCENFLDNFKKESSPIQLFLEESHLVQTTRDSNETMDFQHVYEMYREFCKKQGEKAVVQRSLNADLKRLGFERTRRKQGNVWFAKISKPTDV